MPRRTLASCERGQVAPPAAGPEGYGSRPWRLRAGGNRTGKRVSLCPRRLRQERHRAAGANHCVFAVLPGFRAALPPRHDADNRCQRSEPGSPGIDNTRRLLWVLAGEHDGQVSETTPLNMQTHPCSRARRPREEPAGSRCSEPPARRVRAPVRADRRARRRRG